MSHMPHPDVEAGQDDAAELLLAHEKDATSYRATPFVKLTAALTIATSRIWAITTRLRGVISPITAPGPLRHVEARSSGGVATRGATAYLDGLRGLAALMVVFHHIQQYAQRKYGDNLRQLGQPIETPGASFHFASLPLVRLFFTGGDFAVALFYIMSGYVLSDKPISLISAGDHGGLARNVGSALFRRWFRLFLPIFAVDFIWLTSWHVFSYRTLADGAAQPAPDYLTELRRFYAVMIDLSNFFGSHGNKGGSSVTERIYNGPTWTIVDEFRGSMAIYVISLAFGHFTSRSRHLAEVGLAAYFVLTGNIPMALFALGLFFRDTNLFLGDNALSSTGSGQGGPHSKWRRYFWYGILMLGLYLPGSFLVVPRETRLHVFLAGAVLVMVALPRTATVRSLLESRPITFLGRISYGLYLSHVPLLGSVGSRLFAAFGRFEKSPDSYGVWANLLPLPNWGPLGLEVNVVIPAVIFLAICLACAELFTRWIDKPSIRLAAWLYERGTKSFGRAGN